MAECVVAAYFRWDLYKDRPGLFVAYNVPSFLIGLVALFFLFLLSKFWCYHCTLAMDGVTTKEEVMHLTLMNDRVNLQSFLLR